MTSRNKVSSSPCQDLGNKTDFNCDQCDEILPNFPKFKCRKQMHKRKKSVSCQICGKVFAFAGNLARHRRIHTDDRAYICTICGMPFRQGPHLKEHMSLVHNIEQNGESTSCETGKNQPSKNTSKSNRQIVYWVKRRMENTHECDECGMSFKKASTLKVHKRTHAGIKPYVCNICGKTFNQSSALTKHETLHVNNTSFYCDSCERSYSSANALAVHKLTHTGERPYGCDICGKRFRQNGHVKQHTISVHTKGGKGRSRSKKQDVGFHDEHHSISEKLEGNEEDLKSPTPEQHKVDSVPKKSQQSLDENRNQLCQGKVDIQDLPCEISVKMEPASPLKTQTNLDKVTRKFNKPVVHESQLQDELNSQNAIPDKKKLQVDARDEANENPRTADSLALADENPEILGKPMVDPNQCDVCGKVFKQKSYIKVHMRAHTGEKPFSCQICGKMFRYGHHLRYHERSNCGKRPSNLEGKKVKKPKYKCDSCKRVFNSLSVLELHQKSHERKSSPKDPDQSTNGKPFQCQVCAKTFTRKAYRNIHEKMHNDVRPYRCDVCCQWFKQTSQLANHKKRMHGKSMTNPELDLNPKTKPKEFNVPLSESPQNCPIELNGVGVKILEKNENRYHCNLCAETFELKDLLEYHKRSVHFECEICQKSFTIINNLYRHDLVHTGRKPYVCEICGKGSTQKSNLKSHIQSVHGDHNSSTAINEAAYLSGVKKKRGRKRGMKKRRLNKQFSKPSVDRKSQLFDKKKEDLLLQNNCEVNREDCFTRTQITERINTLNCHKSLATKDSNDGGCDENTEKFEENELDYRVGESKAFVCCECGEKFAEESNMMKHCIEAH